WILDHAVIIHDQAQRELPGELVIQARARQMIHENRGGTPVRSVRHTRERIVSRAQTRQVVDFFELHSREGPKRELRFRLAALGEKRLQTAHRVIVDARASRIATVEADSLEVLAVAADGDIVVKKINVLESLEAASERHVNKGQSSHFKIQTGPDIPILLN